MHSPALRPSHAWGPKATNSDPTARSPSSASLCPHDTVQLPALSLHQHSPFWSSHRGGHGPFCALSRGVPPPHPSCSSSFLSLQTSSAQISTGSATPGSSFVPWEKWGSPKLFHPLLHSPIMPCCVPLSAGPQGAAAGGEGASAPQLLSGSSADPRAAGQPQPSHSIPSRPGDVFNPFSSRWPQPSPALSCALGKVTGSLCCAPQRLTASAALTPRQARTHAHTHRNRRPCTHTLRPSWKRPHPPHPP